MKYILVTAVQFDGIYRYIFCSRTALCIAIEWCPDWRRTCHQPLYENRTPEEDSEVS
jgi:hypothetical protein